MSRIPAIKSNLSLSDAQLGLTLLGMAFGSVIAISFCGWLITRIGSRAAATWSTVAFCLALAPLAIAPNAFALAMSLFVFGATAGTMDVAMNVQGVEVEQLLGKPIMSRLHAMFSFGGMAGAALGGLAAARQVAPLPHFVVSAVASLMLAGVFVRGMISVTAKTSEARWGHLPPELIAIAAIAFCMLLSEGAMSDWTAVYLRQTLLAGAGTAAAGYAVFSAAMAIFRLMGDAITLKLGDVRSVRTGSLVAAAGILTAILAPSAAWALPGFAATGAGFSIIVPIAFGAGGRVPGVNPGVGVATVTGIGYMGFIIGPPAIGFTAQAFTLRIGLGLVVIVCLIVALLSGKIRDRSQA